MSSLTVSNVEVIDGGKADGRILTGIGFFDHMLDQLNSHAQIGIGLQVVEVKEDDGDGGIARHEKDRPSVGDDRPDRWATSNQLTLCDLVGKALGQAMYLALDLESQPENAESRFCCPLDEALVECIIRKAGSSSSLSSSEGRLSTYELAPYGTYPVGKGRSTIGRWQTFAIERFWTSLAEHSHLDISLRKLRGTNGHHIVESSFKAFSRAMRQYLDRPNVFANFSTNDAASIALERQANLERSTKETSIAVHLLLNGSSVDTLVETGIPILDEFFTVLARNANMTLKIQCQGDLWVDDHHTAEDVSIAVGQCLTQALGTKAGLNRMGLATAKVGDATMEVTMDLSNRPYLGHNLHDILGREEYVDPSASISGDGDVSGSVASRNSPLSCEMMEHVLDSLVMNGRMTVHIVERGCYGKVSIHDSILATARAMGQALRVCAMVDQRRAGQTASSKGTLSV